MRDEPRSAGQISYRHVESPPHRNGQRVSMQGLIRKTAKVSRAVASACHGGTATLPTMPRALWGCLGREAMAHAEPARLPVAECRYSSRCAMAEREAASGRAFAAATGCARLPVRRAGVRFRGRYSSPGRRPSSTVSENSRSSEFRTCASVRRPVRGIYRRSATFAIFPRSARLRIAAAHAGEARRT